MKERLLILGSMNEFVELVKLAKSRGYYTVVCDGYAYGPAKIYADKSYNIDVRDTNAIVEMCKRENINGIMGSFSDILFEQITYIAEKANLKWYINPHQLDYYRNKAVARELMASVGIKVPKNIVLEKDFRDEQLHSLTFPLVIKPLDGCGSKGIYIVHSIEEIRQKFFSVLDRGHKTKIIVEEYTEGKEYNLISWLVNGKVYVISIANREKNPQEGENVPLLNRIVYPAKELADILPKATDVLQKFANATGQKNGPMCMQFFFSGEEIVVCEIAGRIFGYEHELVTMGSGLSIEELLLNYVYSESKIETMLSEHSPFFKKCCAGIYFVGKQDKVIANQNRAKMLMKDPHVREGICYYKDGERVDNYGPNPYLVRYYIEAENRDELDMVTKSFFDNMSILADDGSEIAVKFTLEQ